MSYTLLADAMICIMEMPTWVAQRQIDNDTKKV
jgi:hypothetical protein